MARYRFTVTYETDDGQFDTFDEGFEVQSGSDSYYSWDAYTGTLRAGDEIYFFNSAVRETDLRSLSGFTNNSDIIASSSPIGYAVVRTISSSASTIQFTMHPTDHVGTPKTKTYAISNEIGFRNGLGVDFDNVFSINTGGYSNSGRYYLEVYLEEFYEDEFTEYEYTIEGDFIGIGGVSVLDHFEGKHMGAGVTNTAVNDNMKIRVNEREIEYVEGYGLVVTDFQYDYAFSELFKAKTVE